MALLYEQQPRQSALVSLDVEPKGGESRWLTIHLGNHMGVERSLAMEFHEARALAYRLLAVAGTVPEEGE